MARLQATPHVLRVVHRLARDRAAPARPALHGVPVMVRERVGSRELVRAASAKRARDGVTRGMRRREAEARCPGIGWSTPISRSKPARSNGRARGGDGHAARRARTPRWCSVPHTRAVTLFRRRPRAGPQRARRGRRGRSRRRRRARRGRRRRRSPPGSRPGRRPQRRAACRRGRRVGRVPRAVAGARRSATTRSPSCSSAWACARLGDFAALPPDAVLAPLRYRGPSCSTTSRAASTPRRPCSSNRRPTSSRQVELDPPASPVDTAAFAAKGLADRLLDRLAERGLACTRVVIEAETEHGERLSRCWRHDGALSPGHARRARALAARRLAHARLARRRGRRDVRDDRTRRVRRRRPRHHHRRAHARAPRPRRSRPRRRPPTRVLGWRPGGADRADRALARVQGWSATKGSSPPSCRVAAPPPSRCGGCRGVSRAQPRTPLVVGSESPGWPGAVPPP